MLWDKGIGEFVAAAEVLKREGVQARCVLVGQADEDNPACIDAAQLACWQEAGIVEWWGHREDMPAVLASATLVVLPSYREGLPKALLEAAACARPLVATDVPGCREVVRDGVNGLLVPPRTTQPLAQAIKRLLQDGALRRSMGRRGRELVLKEFSSERIARETVSLYRDMLARASSS
jgi:glycosyltransferase involved in cell wall biosynthesis